MKTQLISLLISREGLKVQHPIYILHHRARAPPNMKSKGRKGNTRTFNVIKCVMCLRSILLYHIHVYIDCFICVFYICQSPEQTLQFYSPITLSWLLLHIPVQQHHRFTTERTYLIS